MLNKSWHFILVVLTLACLIFVSCSKASENPGGGVGATLVNSDSIISGEIKAIHQMTTGFPWEIDVLVLSSQDVDNLPNPTKDKIGQVITAKTDENVSALKTGQKITANVKYVGDVPKPGITLYIYNIKVQ